MSHSTISAETIQQWVEKKWQLSTIEAELKSKGFDAEMMRAATSEFKRLRYAKRRFTAFILMGIGAIVGFISCILTVINALPHMFDFFLYGLTIMAAILVFIGLYLLFEG